MARLRSHLGAVLPLRSPLVTLLAASLASGCANARSPPVAVSHAAPPAQLAAFSPIPADPARRAKLVAVAPALDAFFASKLKETGATGFAVGIILDGELVYHRGFGVRDVASATPVDSDTVFRIASMTKSFTALSVMKLRDEGRVKLDEPAATYVPELRALVAPTRDAPPISLRLLLTNAAGLAYDDLWGAVTFGKSDDELMALLRGGIQIPTTPGTRYAYSNLGWALLGKVVESASETRYRDYVTANILLPLGMSSTVWEASDVPPGRLATGYYRVGADLVPEPRPSDGAFAPAGGLYTSLRDYARYVAFQLAAYPPRDDRESGPVRRSTLREMHEGQRWARGDKDSPIVRNTEDGVTLAVPSYGFGWLNVTSCTEEGRIQHGGFEPGYFSWVVLMPRARLGYVALATTAHTGVVSRPGVFNILRDADLLTPPAPIPHPALVATEMSIPKLLVAWDRDLFESVFDPTSVKYSWNKNLRDDFAKLARDHGRCRREGKLEVYGSLHGSFRVVCQRGAIRFDVLLSPATPPRIQNADITEELPPDERTERAARTLVAAIADTEGNITALSELWAPKVNHAHARKILHRLRLAHGPCSIEHGFWQIYRGPFEVEQNAQYALRCHSGPLELELGIDQKTGRVTSFSAHPPRAFDATCWQ
jgi:CubicO group peptidase (beta-lactamase class C family)